MQTEKVALISLVIVIILVLSAFIIVTNPEIMENLFGKEEPKEVAELGDCADVHYIGKYVSDDSVFSSSYDGEPLHVFISQNKQESPPVGYETYYSSIFYPIVSMLIES